MSEKNKAGSGDSGDHICHQREIVEAIGGKVDGIKEELADGKVSFAEIKAMLKAQDVRADTSDRFTKEKLASIETQTIKTNGRVNKLEELSLKPKFGWPAALASIISILTICGALVQISTEMLRIYQDKVDAQKTALGIKPK